MGDFDHAKVSVVEGEGERWREKERWERECVEECGREKSEEGEEVRESHRERRREGVKAAFTLLCFHWKKETFCQATAGNFQ